MGTMVQSKRCYDMAELARSAIAADGWQRVQVAQDLALSQAVPERVSGEGSWLLLKSAPFLVSLTDVRLFNDQVDLMQMNDGLMFHFALDGSVRFDFGGGGSLHHDGYCGMVLAAGKRAFTRRIIASSGRIRYVGVIVSIKDLVDYFHFNPNVLKDQYRLLLSENAQRFQGIDYPLDVEQINAINGILNCRMSGALRRCYISSKLAELVCLALARLSATQKALTHRERELHSLEHAARILESDLQPGLSVQGLSRLVGLNRNKITVGFRQRFGTTPAKFGRGAKLTHARRLVTSTAMSMFEIACEAGFSSQSSFSRAYRTNFGVSPRNDRQQSKAVE